MESARKERKIKIVEQLSQTLKESDSYFVINYQGISAPKITQLRQEIRNKESKLQAIKKNLLKIALEKAGNSELAQQKFDGQTAIVVGGNQPVEIAKTINEFGKEDKKPEFVGGVFENKILASQDFFTIANLPTREELLAKVAGLIKNPINRLILQTKGNQQKLVYALKAIAKGKTD